jgi:hypothetical protein
LAGNIGDVKKEEGKFELKKENVAPNMVLVVRIRNQVPEVNTFKGKETK